MTKQLNRSAFHIDLLRWHSRRGRHSLPWRHTRDPYAVLVSEIMLQQTQVATVLPYFERWLKRFPDFQSLARATEQDVLHAWQGLGYYSRARNLHAAAKAIVARHDGVCPRSPNELQDLPGLGRYTANAVATFAFNQPVPIVDANIGRLIARLFNIRKPIDSSAGREEIWTRAAELVPPRDAAQFNSALMDLGATVCISRAPKCDVCPVKPFCLAKDPLNLPFKRARAELKKLDEHHALVRRNGSILLQQCNERWRGMWMLPPHSGSRRVKPLHVSKFPFTNHQVTLRVFSVPPNGAKRGQRWFPLTRLASIPIPSPHRRALSALL